MPGILLGVGGGGAQFRRGYYGNEYSFQENIHGAHLKCMVVNPCHCGCMSLGGNIRGCRYILTTF